MEVTVEHLGALQFEIRSRGHVIVSDQPEEAGGYDEGMTPPELLLSSLGACAGYYAAQYLRKNQLATEGTRVRVSAEKVKGPPRMENFEIHVAVPVELDQQQEAALREAVQHCLVHNTLQHPPQIHLRIASMEPAAQPS